MSQNFQPPADAMDDFGDVAPTGPGDLEIDINEYLDGLTEEGRCEFDEIFRRNQAEFDGLWAEDYPNTTNAPPSDFPHASPAILAKQEDEGTRYSGAGEEMRGVNDNSGAEQWGIPSPERVQQSSISDIQPNVQPGSSIPSQQAVSGQTSAQQLPQTLASTALPQFQQPVTQTPFPQAQQMVGQPSFPSIQHPATQIPILQPLQTMAQGPPPQIQQTALPQNPSAQVQPPAWDNSILDVSQARNWVTANPTTNVHANAQGDDVAGQLTNRLAHAQSLINACYQAPSRAPLDFTPDQATYFDGKYQGGGVKDVTRLLSTSIGRKRGQCFALIAVDEAFKMHDQNGLGVPGSLNKKTHDPTLKFTERMAHMIVCLGIKRVAEDLLSGNLVAISKLVQDPKALLYARHHYTKNNAGKKAQTKAGKEVLGMKQNKDSAETSAETATTPRRSRSSNFPPPSESQPSSRRDSVMTSEVAATAWDTHSSGQKRRRRSDQEVHDEFTPSRASRQYNGNMSSTQEPQTALGQTISDPSYNTSQDFINDYNARQSDSQMHQTNNPIHNTHPHALYKAPGHLTFSTNHYTPPIGYDTPGGRYPFSNSTPGDFSFNGSLSSAPDYSRQSSSVDPLQGRPQGRRMTQAEYDMAQHNSNMIENNAGDQASPQLIVEEDGGAQGEAGDGSYSGGERYEYYEGYEGYDGSYPG